MLARGPRQPAPSSTKTRCTCSPLVSCWTPRGASWSASTPAALSAGSSLTTSSGSSATSKSADPSSREEARPAGDRTNGRLAFQETHGSGRRDDECTGGPTSTPSGGRTIAKATRGPVQVFVRTKTTGTSLHVVGVGQGSRSPGGRTSRPGARAADLATSRGAVVADHGDDRAP